jgi:hypothetical protein
MVDGRKRMGDVFWVRAERELEEEEDEEEDIVGKVFDKMFLRIDVSLFVCSDTMLVSDLQRIESSSQLEFVEL